MFATVRRSRTWALGAVLLLLAASSEARGAQLGRRMPEVQGGAGACGVRVPLTLEGVVLEPDGRAAEGAVVVSSAGGRAVTDASGRYVLEVEAPLGAKSVEITAAGRSGTNLQASTSVAPATATRAVSVDPLRLARGFGCVTQWVPAFGAAPGLNGAVHAMATFDAGNGSELYVGGDFGSAGASDARNLAKWNGSSWGPVVPQIIGGVRALVVFDDGSGPALYAGGHLTFAGGARIGRFDGSSWTPLGTGLDGLVESLAVFDDGGGPALYAGGEFTVAGGVAASRIAKWDGSSWSALGSGMGSGSVLTLTVFDDGSGAALFAGGSFFSAGGVISQRVAKWNGSAWSALTPGNLQGGQVETLTVFDNGGGPALYAGGWFTGYAGSPVNRVARWTGSSWVGLGTGMDSIVYSLASFDAGAGPLLYAAGSFTTANGGAARRIARWNGTSWAPLGSGLSDTAFTLAVLDDGGGPALLAGGVFRTAGNAGASSVARWNGASWSAYGSGFDLAVADLAVFDDGGGPALYAGGSFVCADGVRASRIAMWDGSSWSAVGSGTNDTVLALTVYDDGGGQDLYAGGFFTNAGGLSCNRIARWNGTSWSSLGSGLNGIVNALAVYDDGSGPKLYAGGGFTTAGGTVAHRIARWNGTTWADVGGGMNAFNSNVEALAVFDDGTGAALYVGGWFLNAGGVPAARIARWDGVSWSALGSGLDDVVRSLIEFDDGSGAALYAGGEFGLAGGAAASRIARWDGSTWSGVGGGLESGASTIVLSLAEFDDGAGPALYAGGSFHTAGGGAAENIAKWDGSSWSPLGGGTSGSVSALAGFDDGDGPALFVGGSFLSTSETEDSFLAKWGCLDEEAPTIFHPTSVGALDRLGSTPGEIVTFSVTATDDQDPSPDVVCVPPSGSLFPPGTTLVDCTATDASGNQSTAQFPVVVRSNVDQRRL